MAVAEGDWIKERDDWDVRPRPSSLVESWIEVAAPSTGSLGNHADKKAVGDGTAYESWCCSPVGWRVIPGGGLGAWEGKKVVGR